MSSTQNYVTSTQLLHTGYAMIVLTSTVVVVRIGITAFKRKVPGPEDYLLLLAYLFFLALTILYIAVTPALYRVSDAVAGKTPYYATIMDDMLFEIKVFFTNTMLLWLTLWSVKFSLLALYRKIMEGLRTYIALWWGVVGFCAVTLVGAIISNFTSCSSMHAWFTPGECTTARDVRAQIASLYYAFAVDVISDLMIMILPLRLIAKLQMPLSRKLGIGALFCLGIVCILMAIIRVVQIGVKAENSSTPSSSWLALWGIVESAIAVIIGCCPAFYASARTAATSLRYGTGSRGYEKQANSDSRSRSNPSHSHSHSHRHSIPLKRLSTAGTSTSASGASGLQTSACYWEEGSSSQEELARPQDYGKGIHVTTSVDQEGGKL